jgi:uncharacterized membrane protein
MIIVAVFGLAFSSACKKSSSSADNNNSNDSSADARASGKNKNPIPYANINAEENSDVASGPAIDFSKNQLQPGGEDPNSIFALSEGRRIILCNTLSQPLSFAIGLKDLQGVTTTMGWTVLKQGECKVAGGANATHVFTYAVSADGKKIWRGDGGNLCVHKTKNFKLVSTIDSSTCDKISGYTMLPFTAHTLSDDTFTVNFK